MQIRQYLKQKSLQLLIPIIILTGVSIDNIHSSYLYSNRPLEYEKKLIQRRIEKLQVINGHWDFYFTEKLSSNPIEDNFSFAGRLVRLPYNKIYTEMESGISNRSDFSYDLESIVCRMKISLLK